MCRKSQIAIEYSHQVRLRDPETWIFWIYSGSAARFSESFQVAADQLDLSGREDPKRVLWLVKSYLERNRGFKWLMVLDNADDGHVLFRKGTGSATDVDTALLEGLAPLEEYLPRSDNGSILITSRNVDVVRRLAGDDEHILYIEPMSENSALQLLENKIEKETELEDEEWKALVRALDYMPLAITQAAAYIKYRKPRSSIASYVKTLQKDERSEIKLLMRDVGDVRRDGRSASNSAILSWHISFEQIRGEKSAASEMLSLMSLFDRQSIPEKLLRMGLAQGSVTTIESDDSTDSEFEDELDILRRYCLVSLIETGDVRKQVFGMHRLVQLSTRKWLEMREELEIWKERYTRILAAAFPESDHKNWPVCQALLPHVMTLLTQPPTNVSLLEKWALIVSRAGTYTLEVGRCSTSKSLHKAALEVREEVLGKEHPYTLFNVCSLATVFGQLGKYKDAEDMYRRALRGYSETLGQQNPITLQCLNGLSVTLMKRGNYEQALDLGVEAFQEREKLLGKDHQDVLASISNLALIRQRQGEFKLAESMNRRSLEGLERVLGHTHLLTLRSVYYLGNVLRKLGKYQESVTMSRRAFEGRQKLLGSEHPDTLRSMTALALVLERQGKYDDAEALNKRVLEKRESMFGVDHPATIMSMNSLSAVLRQQGKFEQAEKMCKVALEGREKIFGWEHSDTLFSVSNMALILQDQGKYEQAEAFNRRAVEARERVLGVDHPATLTSVNNLAAVLREQGEYEQSEEMNARVLQAREKALGSIHSETLRSMTNLALVLQRQGKYEQAEALYTRAIEGAEKSLGVEHPLYLTSVHHLSEALREKGKVEEAEPPA